MSDMQPNEQINDGKIEVDCWQCGGSGAIAGCFEDTCSCTGDPDDPDDCCNPHTCDICGGRGFYRVPADKAEL